MVLAGPSMAAADNGHLASGVPEYALKATFLARIVNFIEWPRGRDRKPLRRFELCVIGPDRFGAYLEGIATEEGAEPAIDVRRVESLVDAEGCRVIFFAGVEAAAFESHREALCNRPVLTVSDRPGFLEAGGMVNFVTEGGRVTLHVNRDATEAVGLRIAASLLDLAELGGEHFACEEDSLDPAVRAALTRLGAPLRAPVVCACRAFDERVVAR